MLTMQSLSRRMASNIEDYALIGDLQICALVARDDHGCLECSCGKRAAAAAQH